MVEVGGIPLEVIGIIILIAIGLSVLAKRVGLNPVLGYIVAGFLLGPFWLKQLIPGDALVTGFSEMGLFILLFYLGLELSLPSFLKAGPSSFIMALIDMTLVGGAGFLIMLALGHSLIFSLIVGFMLFSTSTAIVAKFVIDKKILKEGAAQHAIAILILQDFLGILFLVIIIAVSTGGNSNIGLAFSALVFAVSTFFVVHYLSQRVGTWLMNNGYGHTEVTLYALGIGLLVATIGVMLGLSSAIGAYFAGFALAETPSGNKIKKDIEFMRDFFLVFFFVAFGTTLFYNPISQLTVFPPLNELLFLGGIAILLVGVAFAAHVIVASIFGPLFGLSRQDSALTAILLLPLGEFVIIITNQATKIIPFGEAGIFSVTAFLIIAVSIISFQPIFNNIDHLRAFIRKLPEPFRLPTHHNKLTTHTSYSITLLKKIALNAFIILCLAWVTVLLYEDLPRFGVPIVFSREFTSAIAFTFFAVLPFNNLQKNIRYLFHYLFKGVEHDIGLKKKKRWASE